ncbi:S24 family peptidase [Sinorhizobium sp. BG8]|uniref:S24 family peptidase n=1 Tax=Sinorhizobium sp. BG8 TaxID=2613773 RepID=UPI00193D5405|nr:S24 family peptidase [Sinorhizobium sp. BG8]QRM55126.1 transcriptional regulator [Sinorhizobium sp. BG8]
METDLLPTHRYNEDMDKNWVEAALAHSKLKQAEVTRRLHNRFGWREDRSLINKILKGRRILDAKEMFAISEVTGFPLPADETTPPQTVPLISWVSAGTLSRDDAADEHLGSLIVADLPKGDWIALRVEGNSMDRISPPESIIFVDRGDTKLVNNGCYVIDDGEGNATYKRYRPGPPQRFEPVSTDPNIEPIYFDNEPRVVGRVRRSLINM